jgi:hypothetical protein
MGYGIIRIYEKVRERKRGSRKEEGRRRRGKRLGKEKNIRLL